MNNYDIIILGAGPAGISAGIYAKRAGESVLVIDSGSSTLKSVKKIENYYGFESISGEELLKKGIDQYKKLGGEYLLKEVTRLTCDYDEESFSVFAGEKEFSSKAIILGLGAGKKKTLPLLERFEGMNVSYCAICDGFFFSGKDVAVVGDGEFAFGEAEELSKNAKCVYLISKNGNKFGKLSKNIKVIDKNISSFVGNGLVEEVVFEDESRIKIDGVFVALGSLSSFEIAKQLGLLVTNNNIEVDKNFMTNVAGVFACGDCIGGLKQVSKAVGDGAQAGIEAVRYCKMLEDDK